MGARARGALFRSRSWRPRMAEPGSIRNRRPRSRCVAPMAGTGRSAHRRLRVALVAAGTTVGWWLTRQDAETIQAQAAVDANRDASWPSAPRSRRYGSGSEQLELLDRRIARNSTPPSVRAQVRARATLYATGVVACPTLGSAGGSNEVRRRQCSNALPARDAAIPASSAGQRRTGLIAVLAITKREVVEGRLRLVGEARAGSPLAAHR